MQMLGNESVAIIMIISTGHFYLWKYFLHWLLQIAVRNEKWYHSSRSSALSNNWTYVNNTTKYSSTRDISYFFMCPSNWYLVSNTNFLAFALLLKKISDRFISLKDRNFETISTGNFEPKIFLILIFLSTKTL